MGRRGDLGEAGLSQQSALRVGVNTLLEPCDLSLLLAKAGA